MFSRITTSRRRFVSLGAGAGAALLLAACGGASTPQAPGIGGGGAASTAPGGTTGGAATPASSGMPAGGNTVYTLFDKTTADTGARDATTLYNKARPGAPQIAIEDAADGWDAKVLPQIKDKNLRWGGNGYIPYADQYKRIKQGIAAPLDELLKSSKTPWAQKQKDGYFTPRIYDALLLDGKQYYVPMKINVHMAGWRQDYLEAAGYPTMPKTWDEVDRMLPKIKAATAKDNVIPFSIQRDIWRTLGTTFATFTEKTMDDQGVFRVDSPEWLEMIGMFKKWIDAGLARFDTVEDAVDAWQKGKFAMSLTSHSWVRLGRQVWGADKVKGGVPPQANATAPARTWCHIDSSCVFVDAPNAQDATDWLLAILGPEGTPAETWYKGTLTFSGSPPYQSMIDKFVTPNPDIKEIGDVLAILPNSTIATIVQANGFGITQLKLAPWLDRYFKGELSAKDAMTKFRAEVDAEFAKQKA